MGDAYLVQVPEEGHPYIFFEKPAEGLLPKSGLVRDLLERDRLLIVLLHVGDDAPQPVGGEPIPLFVRGQHAGGEIPYEPCQHLQGQPLRLQVKGGCVLYVESGDVLQQLADLQIGGEFFIAYQVRPAKDVVVLNVGHAVLEKFSGYVDTKEHGGLVIAEGAVHLHGLDGHNLFFREREFRALHGDVRQAVQGVQDLQLLVPVERAVASRRGVEGQVYTGVPDVVEGLVVGVVHMQYPPSIFRKKHSRKGEINQYRLKTCQKLICFSNIVRVMIIHVKRKQKENRSITVERSV